MTSIPIVGYQRFGNIVALAIDNPPVNALAHRVRVALLEAVIAADLDADVGGIIIHGVGPHFVAGADITEFDRDPMQPLLNDVLLRIEDCKKPVIAVIHGAALGGGLELALACHYRFAARSASLGLPEIRLGLLPGAGGTQRLPRLIGVQGALALTLSGEPISGARALDIGMLDLISDSSDILADAVAYAQKIVASGAGPRRLRDHAVQQGRATAEFVAEQRAIASRKFPGVAARESIIECIDAAVTMPFEEALDLSRKRFEQARQSVASRALRHLFFAERSRGTSIEGRTVSTVGVLGAGTMGSGIAVSFATAGFAVTLVDTAASAVTDGLERIRGMLRDAVGRGRIGHDAAAAALARVTLGEKITALENANLIIEAVYEKLAIKQEVFASLGKLCRPGAVLASNTSTLDIDAIAKACERPQDVVGMHFFSPANIMRLVEIVRGSSTAPDVVATAANVSRRMGKLGVIVGNGFGFVGNRMLYAYGRENQYLLLEGATPSQIDSALEKFGMAMGPNAVGDLAGLDVGFQVRRERKDLPADPRYFRVANLLVEAGRLGQKTGRGAFRYMSGSRRPIVDTEVEAMIVAEAARLGIVRRTIPDLEIQERCIYALINEGARVLSEGIAASPADIDVIWCNGYGFGRFRGGPMFYADTLGPEMLVERIRYLASVHGPDDWTPAPLLVEIAERGETFAAWQSRRV
jgi:3-hydroxyacyl-CoA dehydrogenase